jgi:hypothetical protein
MKSLKPIIIILLVSKLAFTQTSSKLEKNKFEISIKLEATKRKSDKYFDNDTNMYTIDQKKPEKYYRNNNYLAGNIGVKRFYPKHFIISTEFRYKLWGFNEYFLSPYQSYGFSYTLFNMDLSFTIQKRFILYSRLEIRPRIGITIFRTLTKGFDSTVYYNFEISEYNNYYLGSPYKIGMNMGPELNYKIVNRVSFTASFVYYTPFNNNYGWTHGERVAGTQYPWRKYRKKNDGLYLGFGMDYGLTK